MIELGQIRLEHAASVYDARNKIRGLANALGYDAIDTTRLATAVSEGARVLRGQRRDACIGVALAPDCSPPQLLIDFDDPCDTGLRGKLAGFFDSLGEVEVDDGGRRLRGLRWLPAGAANLTDAFLEAQRQRIQTPSREELVAEIERKNRDLERHSAELEETVAQRTEQLEQAMKLADAANKAKGDFLANMSHEIRTPMNAIIGLSDLCLKTELSEKQRDYLSKVHSSAQSLLGIINDILDFSKIEAGKLDIETVAFSIDNVLENLATVVQVKAREKGIELLFDRSPDVPGMLLGDPLRLGQILLNLANNAAKFTASGEIVVKVEVAEKRGEQLLLRCTVSDTGIGMNDEQMQRLFQSFSQADTSTTRKYGGTGLGLAISRQLVELMDGDIWVESVEGEGSTFGFTVELGVAAEAPAGPFRVAPELGELSCLVVDDNATSRDILVQYLSTFGLTVATAASAQEAFQRLESGALDCDLVVTDWKMPGMDGIELSSDIRSSASLNKQPKIILVSAFHRVELMGRPGAHAVDRFLSKPVSPSHLFDAIMECFGRETQSGKERVSHLDSPADDLAPIRGAQVLLVEDNEINQQVASELLEQAGLVVTIANNGLEAIEQVEQGDFDVVLMDIQMPVMDGYEATGRLRSEARYAELPILAMTANATLDDREKSLQVGMNAHINKPINPVDLFNALLTWVKPGERAPVAPREQPQSVSDTDSLDLLAGQGFDVQGGIARVGGSAGAYRRLLQKFSTNQGDSVARLRAAVQAGDQELAVRTVHSLKGAAGALGISPVQALAGTLEELLAGVPLTLDEQQCEALAASLAAAVQAIEEALPNAAGAAAADNASSDRPIGSDIIAQLEKLKTQLEDFDSEAEDTLDLLREGLAGSALAAELAPIAKQVAAYELEAAAEQLQLVLGNLGEAGSE